MCLQNSFLGLLLVNWMPDLHCAASNLTGGGVHLHAAKGCAAQSIPPSAPANGDDEIAGLRGRRRTEDGQLTLLRRPSSVLRLAARQQPKTPCKHKRVCGITRVKINRAVHSRDAHLVAVVLNAVNHTIVNAFGWQHTGRKDGGRQTEGGQIVVLCLPSSVVFNRPKTQHIRICNRAGAYTQHIADDTAQARVGTAKGL